MLVGLSLFLKSPTIQRKMSTSYVPFCPGFWLLLGTWVANSVPDSLRSKIMPIPLQSSP